MKLGLRFLGVAIALGVSVSSLAARAGMPCPSVSLKGATGVIGEEHSYKVSGHCEKLQGKTETSESGGSSKSTSVGFDFSGKASWDRDTGLAKESLSLKGTMSGSPTGKRVVQGICSQDPFLVNPPGGAASCHSVKAQADVSSGPTLELLVEPSFWLAKHISLQEAQALSQAAAANPPKTAQAPPPKKKPVGLKDAKRSEPELAPVLAATLQPPAPKPGPLGLEAEGLLASQRIFPHGGNVAAQSMTRFGGGWSGGSQVFWSGGQVGSWLDLVVDIPASGTYSLAIYLTKAPDYAQVKVEVDGDKALDFEGFAKQVEPSGPLRAGRFDLQAGPRRVRLTITGKHAGSRGLLVGVDRVDLIPVSGS